MITERKVVVCAFPRTFSQGRPRIFLPRLSSNKNTKQKVKQTNLQEKRERLSYRLCRRVVGRRRPLPREDMSPREQTQHNTQQAPRHILHRCRVRRLSGAALLLSLVVFLALVPGGTALSAR